MLEDGLRDRWLSRALGAACLLSLNVFGPPVQAGSVTLTYDDPVIRVAAGGSAIVTATLSVSSDSSGPFVTNSAAEPIVGPPVSYIGSLSYLQEEYPDSILTGTLDYLLNSNSIVSFTASSALANLDVAPGSSIDLVLGTFYAYATLPTGVYTADIGINQACVASICDGLPFSAPNFLDPGALTIEVAAVPEPSLPAILSIGLLGLSLIRRRRVR
ncbi:PEP-CTERM sorting domain-containing protein [Telmatospirillum sp.]|uniref:PEP-CTERM sorting domain-containing protein n=1 Tax=Telmatospirillum sp. TaxID=2079197 RepID=UPI00283DCF95|nr:PEP-CTERM sorting domain-containing protein [Telmatospirillum sp.]MDR3438321.1 PEP-CTERM sorting domain-containing protein [Telmatospirillum sp.]